MNKKKHTEKLTSRRTSHSRAFILKSSESPKAPMHWSIGL